MQGILRRTWKPLAVVVALGTGALAGNQVVESRRATLLPGERKKLVIIGSGWSAVALVKGLWRGLYDVTVISNRNYFLFTPLLPSATVGALDAAALIEPVRRICARVNGTFAQAAVVDIDDKAKQVVCRDKHGAEFRVPYDMLVLAVGAKSVTFGVEGVEEHCHFLKSLGDARKIRMRVMQLFEEAALPHLTDDQRRKLLSFVVVGGGPTGVEFAAELRDFLAREVPRFFPQLVPFVSVTLVHSADHILNTYDAAISKYAEQTLKAGDLKVLLNSRVTRVRDGAVEYRAKGDKGNETQVLPFGLCVWSTGVGPWPLAQQLIDRLPEQRNSRAIMTDQTLRVIGMQDVFAIGDCATIHMPKLLSKAMDIFHEHDVNGDGVLDMTEFDQLAGQVMRRYPLLEQHFAKTRKLFMKYDIDHSETLSLDELTALLKEVDQSLKALPATAQVAAQQGAYLADVLNGVATKGIASLDDAPRFRYRHLGSMAYVGSDRAVVDFGGGVWGGGLGALMLWRSAYMSKQVSNRTRFALAVEWLKTPFFGRDITDS